MLGRSSWRWTPYQGGPASYPSFHRHARLFSPGRFPMLVRFPFREAATGSGRHRQPSPHRGREAQSFLPSAENKATDAGRAIRSSVHRTSERHTLKTVTATNSQRAVRLTLLRLNYQSPDGHLEMSLAFTIFASEAGVASWGFCKQKHRSTPIGALAPTRLPLP